MESSQSFPVIKISVNKSKRRLIHPVYVLYAVKFFFIMYYKYNIHMIKGAWSKVKTETIKNCWKKGGFANDELTNVIIPLPPSPVGQSEEEFRNWVSIDDDVEIVQNQTEEEFTENLVSMIQNQDGVVKISDDEDDDNDGSEEETPSAAEMRKCFRRSALGLERTGFKKMNMLCDMKEEVDGHLRKTFPPKQTSLRRFFCVE